MDSLSQAEFQVAIPYNYLRQSTLPIIQLSHQVTQTFRIRVKHDYYFPFFGGSIQDPCVDVKPMLEERHEVHVVVS